MGLTTECDKEGNILVKYDLKWVHDLLRASSGSMVGYSWFAEKGSGFTDHRSYPRSSQSSFTLGAFKTDDAKGGGRSHEYELGVIMDLGTLLGSKSRAIPLSDIAISSKRSLCTQVTGTKYKTLHTRGGVLEKGLIPDFGAYGYPMLCILGDPQSKLFPVDQAEWRLVQSLFAAVLTYYIRSAGIGLEVVSREGFGSLFPTLADLPTGIRLDPGLLPPEAGAKAIQASLQVVDAFIEGVRKTPPWKSNPKWLGELGGMSDSALSGVDRLTSFLHAATHEKNDPAKCDYAKLLSQFNGTGNEKCLPPLEKWEKVSVEYTIASMGQVADQREANKFKRQKLLLRDAEGVADKEVDVEGYGSESDYDEETEDDPPFTLHMKKYSVATGMAALRMAVRYGAEHSVMLCTEGKWAPKEHKLITGVTTWAPYFELDYTDLVKSVAAKSKEELSLLVFDGAPNPINAGDKAPPSTKAQQWGAIVIDTTNNTSREKAIYVLATRPMLAKPEETGGVGGLLILIDSASKHPTGGDLVHGVIRVCGTMAALTSFHKRLTQHLKGDTFKASPQTLLLEKESKLRRAMLHARMFTRNLDIFRLVSGLGDKD